METQGTGQHGRETELKVAGLTRCARGLQDVRAGYSPHIVQCYSVSKDGPLTGGGEGAAVREWCGGEVVVGFGCEGGPRPSSHPIVPLLYVYLEERVICRVQIVHTVSLNQGNSVDYKR